MVSTTFLRKSGFPLTYQIPPVMDAATLIAFTLFQRSRPPCAFTATANSSFISIFLFLAFCEGLAGGGTKATVTILDSDAGAYSIPVVTRTLLAVDEAA